MTGDDREALHRETERLLAESFDPWSNHTKECHAHIRALDAALRAAGDQAGKPAAQPDLRMAALYARNLFDSLLADEDTPDWIENLIVEHRDELNEALGADSSVVGEAQRRDERGVGPDGHCYSISQLHAMLAAAELYEAQADEPDRRTDDDACFIFYKCGAGEVPSDEPDDVPSLPGIYMADADVPDEGVLPVITYATPAGVGSQDTAAQMKKSVGAGAPAETPASTVSQNAAVTNEKS